LPTHPPTTHTLPYTTLFRSLECKSHGHVEHSLPQELAIHRTGPAADALIHAVFSGPQAVGGRTGRGVRHELERSLLDRHGRVRKDRKSTRLNSSHVASSYAV